LLATNATLQLTGFYSHVFGALELSFYAIGAQNANDVIDTSTFKYNWNGDFIQRDTTVDPKGELFERRTQFRISDRIFKEKLSMRLWPDEKDEFSLALLHNALYRSGRDLVDEWNISFESPNTIHTAIVSAGYSARRNFLDTRTSLFGKQYFYQGTIFSTDLDGNASRKDIFFSKPGYGAAVSMAPFHGLRLKGSFERTYRIPESYEILGDGIYIYPNDSLLPENSFNYNVGIRYHAGEKPVSPSLQINGFYRNSRNFIAFDPLGPFGEYINLHRVKTIGLESSAKLQFANTAHLAANATYQHITDNTKVIEGLPNTNYGARIPNRPFFFANANFSITSRFTKLGFTSTTTVASRYVHPFFKTWARFGNPDSKAIIPEQISHTVENEFSFYAKRLNITVSAENLFDAALYDNYKIQKPGRSFAVKLRYHYSP